MSEYEKASLRLVLFGKPGAGKGTQAEAIERDFGLPHLSSGDMLRAEIKEGTPLGKKVEGFVLKGEIGPKDLITEAILEFIERTNAVEGFVLDGFPRTIYQAEKLDNKYEPDLCVLLEISDTEAIERLSRRYTCEKCGAVYNLEYPPSSVRRVCERCGGALKRRPDDNPSSIEKRLKVFEEESGPVVRYYGKKGKLKTVDASLSPGEVSNAIGSLILEASGPPG